MSKGTDATIVRRKTSLIFLKRKQTPFRLFTLLSLECLRGVLGFWGFGGDVANGGERLDLSAFPKLESIHKNVEENERLSIYLKQRPELPF